jgi:hypothetical protein
VVGVDVRVELLSRALEPNVLGDEELLGDDPLELSPGFVEQHAHVGVRRACPFARGADRCVASQALERVAHDLDRVAAPERDLAL